MPLNREIETVLQVEVDQKGLVEVLRELTDVVIKDCMTYPNCDTEAEPYQNERNKCLLEVANWLEGAGLLADSVSTQISEKF